MVTIEKQWKSEVTIQGVSSSYACVLDAVLTAESKCIIEQLIRRALKEDC